MGHRRLATFYCLCCSRVISVSHTSAWVPSSYRHLYHLRAASHAARRCESYSGIATQTEELHRGVAPIPPRPYRVPSVSAPPWKPVPLSSALQASTVGSRRQVSGRFGRSVLTSDHQSSRATQPAFRLSPFTRTRPDARVQLPASEQYLPQSLSNTSVVNVSSQVDRVFDGIGSMPASEEIYGRRVLAAFAARRAASSPRRQLSPQAQSSQVAVSRGFVSKQRQPQRSRGPTPAPATPPNQDTSVAELDGVVRRIVFASEKTGYKVVKIERGEQQQLETIVGNLPPVNVGAAVRVKGIWQSSTKYGRQLKVHDYSETAPATREGIENYLASGLVRGIGPVAAREIVDRFGTETMSVLNEAPWRLAEVKGIGCKKAKTIQQAWREQEAVRALMLFLQNHNVSTALAPRLYKQFGEESVELLKIDPYRLLDDASNIGFRTVDRIALQTGFDPQSPTRCKAGLTFALKEQANNEGHCYLTHSSLLTEGHKLLSVSRDRLGDVIDIMVKDGQLICHPTEKGQQKSYALFLPLFDESETSIAERIADLIRRTSRRGAVAKGGAGKWLQDIEKENGVAFDDVQRSAILTAATASKGRFTVLTGGPGTGKTTVAQAIIKVYERQGARVALAAPTNRAAQRLSEGTGLEVKTLHRLLEYSSETRTFLKCATDKLACDVLVVDEASMVDVLLMSQLLRALPASCSLVLVGDVDQLPPVGPGNVLRDIIAAAPSNVVVLQKIFRQSERSAVVTNAHRINAGKMPDLSSEEQSDFFHIETDPSKVVDLVKELCTQRLPKHYGIDPISDIQVLCPMKKGEVGTLNLNTVLQAALNPKGQRLKYGTGEFRKGDKVMQVKNCYEKNVFNGGLGTIVEVNLADKSVTVSFDSNIAQPITYGASELEQLTLAYAATVHKAQGSEYKVVVAPLVHTQHHIMLQRNLLYTCVTRARQMIVLVGEMEAIQRAVRNAKTSRRNSLLTERLKMAKDRHEIERT